MVRSFYFPGGVAVIRRSPQNVFLKRARGTGPTPVNTVTELQCKSDQLRKAYKVSIQVSEGVSSTGLRKQGLQMARFNSSRLDSPLSGNLFLFLFFR